MSSKVRSFPLPADDAPLRRRFQAGDRSAFERLARPHLDVLYTLCLRILGEPTDAEDVAQDTLLRAMDRCRYYDPERAFRPWLLSIATNLCRDRLRTVWWRRVVGWTPRAETAVPPRAESQAEAGERDAQVRAAMLQLPVIYREAVALFHLEDMSYSQMEEITGVSQPALKQRVRRGTQLLREILLRLYPDVSISRIQSDSP